MRNTKKISEYALSCLLVLLVLFLFPSCIWADGMEEEPPGVQHKSEPVPVISQPKAQQNKTPPIRKAGKTGNTKPLEEFELGRYQYCGADADCVPATNGCCDCANGGDDVAINKLRVQAFEGRFDCLHVACGRRDADPPCGEGVVTCLNHKCKYVSDRGSNEL